MAPKLGRGNLSLVQDRREDVPISGDSLAEAINRLQRVRAATKRAVDNGWEDPHGLALLHAVEGLLEVGARLLATRKKGMFERTGF